MKPHRKTTETLQALAGGASLAFAAVADPTITPQWAITLAFLLSVACGTLLALPIACDLAMRDPGIPDDGDRR